MEMRLLLILVLAGVAATIAAVADVDMAGACSCGNDCEGAVHQADLIVEGRITAWERAPGYFGDEYTSYVPILLRMDVKRVFKGTTAVPLVLVDSASLTIISEDGTKTAWVGAAGACGSFDEEPTGLYVIAALYRDQRGNYRMSRITTVFLGQEPGGERYDFVVAKLTENVGPPVVGSAGLAAADGGSAMVAWGVWLLLLGLGGLVVIGAGGRITRGRHGHR